MKINKVFLLIMLLFTALTLSAKPWEADQIKMVHLADARRYVCDPDHLLTPTERDSIDSYLYKLDKQCGVESVFVIVRRVSNGDTFRFAQDLGNRVGVGSKKTNRGLVVVVAVDDHRYFIAPGEGLEKDLTDVECDDIGQACIVANMKQNKPGEAVLTTAKAVYNKFKTGETGLDDSDESDDALGIVVSIVTAALVIAILGLLTRRDNRGNRGGNSGNRGRNSRQTNFIIWGNPGHTNDFGGGLGGGFSGGSFGGGSFGGGGAGGGW